MRESEDPFYHHLFLHWPPSSLGYCHLSLPGLSAEPEQGERPTWEASSSLLVGNQNVQNPKTTRMFELASPKVLYSLTREQGQQQQQFNPGKSANNLFNCGVCANTATIQLLIQVCRTRLILLTFCCCLTLRSAAAALQCCHCSTNTGNCF